MSKIEQMFDFKGKTAKIIGSMRTKVYHEHFNHKTEKQNNKELSNNKD